MESSLTKIESQNNDWNSLLKVEKEEQKEHKKIWDFIKDPSLSDLFAVGDSALAFTESLDPQRAKEYVNCPG